MAGSVPGTDPYPVWLATSFATRLAGIHAVPAGHGIVLRATSVHGRGLAAPLRVIWLDQRGGVIAVSLLLPGRRVRCGRAAWAVEVPAMAAVPAEVGDRVRLVRSSAPCPAP